MYALVKEFIELKEECRRCRKEREWNSRSRDYCGKDEDLRKIVADVYFLSRKEGK